MLRVSLRQIFDANHPAPAGFFDDEIMTRRPEQLPECFQVLDKLQSTNENKHLMFKFASRLLLGNIVSS